MNNTLKYEYYIRIWGATVSHLEEMNILPADQHEFYFLTKAELSAFKEVLFALEKYVKSVKKDALFGLAIHEEHGPQVRFRPILNAIVLYKGEYIHVSERWLFAKPQDDSTWEYILEWKFDIAAHLGPDVDPSDFSVISTFVSYEYVPSDPLL